MKSKILCKGHDLMNVYNFKYLGSIFSTDGSHTHDVKWRCVLPEIRCVEVSHVFGSKSLPLELCRKIYHTTVWSLLIYVNETWNLTASTTRMAKINGCNTRFLSHITERTDHAEANALTRTLDLVGEIRQHRYLWLVHILYMTNNRLLKETIKVQFIMRFSDNIFMNVPQELSFHQLEQLTQDRGNGE